MEHVVYGCADSSVFRTTPIHADCATDCEQQRLYFWPEPQGQTEFRPGSGANRMGVVVQDCAGI
jgi:hypothetical protein